jgi:hypothetical protein
VDIVSSGDTSDDTRRIVAKDRVLNDVVNS